MKRVLYKAALRLVCLAGGVMFRLARLFHRPRQPSRLGKVLVIKLWAIGEVVMATPALEALKRHDPDCEVHVLVGKTAAPVVQNNPFCDRVIAVDDAVFLRFRILEIMRLVSELRREGYDTAIVLHHLFVFGLFAWLLRIPVRAGLDRAGEGFALTLRVPRPTAKTHHVVEYLMVVKALGVAADGLLPRIWLDESWRVRAEQMLKEILEGERGRRAAVLLPTGGANAPAAKLAANIVTKRWPPEYYAELACKLAQDGWDVLVLGGPGEAALRPRFENLVVPGVRVMIGRLGLGMTMAIMKLADAVVTNDSGPMQIAAALDARLLAIFGPTDPELVGPANRRAVVLRSEEPCAPCFNERVFPNIVPACQHQRCMRSITPQMVYDMLETLPGRPGKR